MRENSTGKRRGLRLAFTAVMTVVVAVLLLENVSWRGVGEVLRTVQWQWLAAMSGMALVRTLVDSLLMKTTLRRLRLRVRLGTIFLSNALSCLYGLILPGALVSRGAKWGVLASATGNGTAVLNAMMYNGMMQLVPIFAVGCVAMAVERPWPGTGLTEATVVATVGVLAALVVLYHPRIGSRAASILERFAVRLPDLVRRRITRMNASLADFQRFPRQWHAATLVLAFAGLGCALTRMFFGFQALGIELSPLRISWIFIFLHILRLLPITIGNFGVREGFLMLALAGFDVPQETAVSLGLLLYTDRLVLAFIGAGYQTSLLIGLAVGRPVVTAANVPRTNVGAAD